MSGDGADSETRALIALSTVQGLGPARLRSLMECFGSATSALSRSTHELRRVPGIGESIAADIVRLDPESVSRDQLMRGSRAGVHMVRINDKRYPPLLREIHDPPPFLWCRGETADLECCVAVVGTRTPTDYGRVAARHLSVGLVEAGYVIVSGLAYGIDAVAHRSALEVGGRTVAVLGSGADVIYPAPHRGLFKKIVSNGAILSAFPLGAKPDAVNFPRRNRLISGMSLGVVVVEARETGGGLITARQALDQNREVFCVPGSIFHPANVGTNGLIRDGEAKLVSDVSDILEELQPSHSASFATRKKIPTDELEPVEHDLVNLLGNGPVHIDSLAEMSKAPRSQIMSLLLSLEMRGWIGQGPGMMFYLVRERLADSRN